MPHAPQAAPKREEITLRPATAADYDFMRLLYHSTRAEEMQNFPFDDAQRDAFLDQQFAAQTEHYDIHYPTVQKLIIELRGQPVGRLYVDEWESQIRIVDIALSPEVRGGGVGTMLLRDVLDDGASKGKRVTIHVEAFNPALRLYDRLGFRQIDTNGIYYLMEWVPPAAAT